MFRSLKAWPIRPSHPLSRVGWCRSSSEFSLRLPPTMPRLSSPRSAGCRKSKTTSWSRPSDRSCATSLARKAGTFWILPTIEPRSSTPWRMRSDPKGCGRESLSRKSSSATRHCRPSFWFRGFARNADQLQVTYQQEQKAQTQRIETEKARATAEQQHQLVEAVIGVQVSEQNKNAAKLRGEGQKLELEEIAQGQRAQADVLGQDRVLTINLVQQLLKTIQDKPEVVSLIGRLVPQTVVSTGGQGTGLDSAAAIIGALLNSGGAATSALTGQSPKK